MITPTYGPSFVLVPPDDVVARIDELIPRNETTEVPLVWRARNVDAQVLIAARNEILRLRAASNEIVRLRARVAELEKALSEVVDHCRRL